MLLNLAKTRKSMYKQKKVGQICNNNRKYSKDNTLIIVNPIGEESVSSEVRGLFSSSKQQNDSQQGSSSGCSSESVLARADRLCKELKRPGKHIKKYRNTTKPYSRPSKEFQKNLVVIDYQGTEEIMPLAEYQKIYDGCIRYNSKMTEREIREEIVRLAYFQMILIS